MGLRIIPSVCVRLQEVQKRERVIDTYIWEALKPISEKIQVVKWV